MSLFKTGLTNLQFSLPGDEYWLNEAIERLGVSFGVWQLEKAWLLCSTQGNHNLFFLELQHIIRAQHLFLFDNEVDSGNAGVGVFQKQTGSYVFEYYEQPIHGKGMVNSLIFSENVK